MVQVWFTSADKPGVSVKSQEATTELSAHIMEQSHQGEDKLSKVQIQLTTDVGATMWIKVSCTSTNLAAEPTSTGSHLFQEFFEGVACSFEEATCRSFC